MTLSTTTEESAKAAAQDEPTKAGQSDLIDRLGGPTAVAELVSTQKRLERPLTSQAVSMWRTRGIPWSYRPAIAKEATARGLPVPDGFLD